MAWTPTTDGMVVYLVDGEDLTQIPIVPGSLTISGSIDDDCRACTFSLAGQPSPRPQRGDTILVRYLDFDNDLMYDVYGGKLNRPDTESDPWQQQHTASDQLKKLGRTKRGGDLSLTGLTDGGAWKAVADYCGIDYDDADIGDAGYVIGSEEPIKWHDDGSTSGASILQELDRVFGFKTMTIQNNRVIRIPYDPTPTTSTGSYRTLEKGETVDWNKHHRGGGSSDDIVNRWKVTGASIQINDQCTATVWADAYDSVTDLGHGVSAADGTFQSDLIQSEDLAEAIVRRQMRINNRVQEIGSSTIGNDPNVYPCTKLTLQDTTYGIGADPRYAIVSSYRWTYPNTDIDFFAGPPGDEGSVDTGVDKVCNDDHSDLDLPGGGFDFPSFDFPPVDFGDPLDFTPPDFSWDPTGLLDVHAIPVGGTFGTPITVRLVPRFVCIIYYTDDGSTPTTSSTMYTTDITITETTTLKFFGKKDDDHISPIRTEVYTIDGGLGGLEPIVWTTAYGSVLYPGDDVHFVDTLDAATQYTGGALPFDGSQRIRWAGHAEFDGTDEGYMQFYLQVPEGGSPVIWCGLEILISSSTVNEFYLADFDGGVEVHSVDLSGGFDFLLDFDPGTGNLTATIAGIDYVIALGDWSEDVTLNLSHGEMVTIDWTISDMTLTVGG